MARTEVEITRLVANDSISNPAGTTIDATLVTNGVVIKKPPFRGLIIRVNNTAGAAKNVTVQAGAEPIAAYQEYGDLVEQIPATTGSEFFYLEGSRFAQANGDLWIDFESGTTGTIAVIALPKNGMRD